MCVCVCVCVWARIAQLVQRLATGWTMRGSNSGSGVRLSATVQTGSRAHPAFYTVGTGHFGRKGGPGVALRIHVT